MKKSQIIEILQKHEISYQSIPIGGGYDILIVQRGGRVYGPFGADNTDGIFWMPDFWEQEESFSAFLDSGSWNMGGDRVWIAPELQFSVKDRSRFWETLQTPKAIDPGAYTLLQTEKKAVLFQSMELSAGILAEGRIRLDLERVVQPAANPLEKEHDFDRLTRGVTYCGYTHTLCLTADGSKEIAAACWNLLQVRPTGYVYIPMFQAQNGVNYYEPIKDLERLTPAGIVLKATGHDRYKVGYKAAGIMGRFGYTGACNGEKYLLIRNFPNDPSNIYNEEPPLMPGESGFSVHVYNDDGLSGGFTEIECNLLSVGVPAGHASAMDRITTWIFFGTESGLREIGRRLLGFENIEFP